MSATIEFVKGWHLLDTLGEGRFGEVKLLINKNSHEMVAVKVLIIKNSEMDKLVKKEICIHRNLRHENIITFYGNRRDDESRIEYLFLEYAQNGELFDHIEPDIGMDKFKAFKFFNDLLNGIEYLHQHGIVHRDIKPENLLFNTNYKLKISDFGMATLFRHKGKERLLNQICGSIPYIAPEVFNNEPHYAQPLDIWSCGIVLVAMLTGELPWSEATAKNCVFNQWIQEKCNFHLSPWCKIETVTLALLKSILNLNPAKRLNIERIRLHRAYVNNYKPQECNNIDRKCSFKRKCINVNEGFLSQPQQEIGNNSPKSNITESEMDYFNENNVTSFSQPNRIQDMFLSTQTQMELDENGLLSGSNKMTPPEAKLCLRIVRRMTRFLTNKNYQHTVKSLEKGFNDLNWSWKRETSGQYKIHIVDSNRIPLIFRALLHEMSLNRILVEFRFSKGDGIEFKRKFLMIRNLLKPIIELYGDDLISRFIDS